MTNTPEYRRKNMRFNTQKYRQLELFIKTEPGETGRLYMVSGSARKMFQISQYRKWLKITVNPGTTYEVSAENCEISYAYLSGCEQMLERGICMIQDGRFYDRSQWGEWYDTPIRNQYHLSPPKGWMNDPNGFCVYHGYYHLFYQFQPFSEEWDNMYWGHAVSQDLIHWVHLPVCMEPQQEILNYPELVGGAFSGTALVDEEQKLRLFFTRHIGKRRDRTAFREYQVMTESRDGLNWERESRIIEGPEGRDFRDPKVFYENGEYKMLIGIRGEEHPAISLYKSYNLAQWTYCGEIFEEQKEEENFPLECPDLFRLDNQWVLTAGYCGHVDGHGRKNSIYYHIGEWYQDQFHEEARGLYDFGADFYAVQTIDTETGRVAVGWISDVAKEHVKSPNGACGSMSIPRVLHIKDGKLYQNPVQGIYRLIRYPVYEGCGEDVEVTGIEGNTYYVKLEMEKPSDFRMTLYKWKDRKLYLEQKDGQCRFRTVGEGAKNILYPAEISDVTTVEVFVDRNVCEVFLNDGQAAGAKKFYQQSETGNFEFHVQEKGTVKSLVVEKMEGIWKQ